MLEKPFLITTSSEINKLISDGNYKYLNYCNYNIYNSVELLDTDRDEIQRVSVDDNGNILGYFSVNIDQSQRRMYGTCFVKFKYKYYEYAGDPYKKSHISKIARDDFYEFVDMLMNHPVYNGLSMSAIAENPANKVYEQWLDKYNGERFLFKDYVMLTDGKYYDSYTYWFKKL